MRAFALVAILLTVTACAPKDSESPYDRANRQADAAFAELEADIEREYPTEKPLMPRDVPNPVEELPPVEDTPIIEDKENPRAVADKARQGRGSVYPMENGKPVWLNNPGYMGHFGGIGYAAAAKDYSLQKRVALSTALADLSKNVNVLIYNEVEIERILIDTATVQDYKERYSSLSRQDVMNQVARYEELDEWTDANGVLYVWIALK